VSKEEGNESNKKHVKQSARVTEIRESETTDEK
jgi:hypothetical protein